MTRRKQPTRLYFDLRDGTYAPFMWFHEHAPLEMMMGFHGLSSTSARLSFEYPERNVSIEEAKSVKFKYGERHLVDRPLEHVTVHASGEFHIKLKDAADPYVHRLQGSRPLDTGTPQFLDFKVLTEPPGKYRTVTNPKRPYVPIPCPDNAILLVDGRFSGGEHDLEGSLLREVQRTTGRSEYGAIQLSGKYLKGMLRPTFVPVDTAVLANKPPGTILAFFFPTADQRYLVKAFHFC
jgi:hypothetical protein